MKVITVMNRTLLPTICGVFVSLLLIWTIHTYVLVDSCLDNGGTYDYPKGQCILVTGDVYQHDLANIMVLVYVIVGFGISFIVSNLLRKLLKQ